MRLVYCGPEKWSDVGQYKSYQVLYGNSSMRLVYCGPEKWSDVKKYKSHQEVLYGNPSMRLIYSFAPLNYL